MNKYKLYLRALSKVINSRLEDEYNEQLIRKTIFYSVRIINMLPESKSYDEAISNYNIVTAVKQDMSGLTPKEFMNIFPIQKDFKGHKFEMKDYFYTIDYINSLDENEPIGDEITMFLMEYTNEDIFAFSIKMMTLMSDIRRFEGKPSLAEEWANENGLETYILHSDQHGNDFILDKHGRTKKVVKPKPKHLKAVN